jgi:hypothetical protein
LKLIFSRFFLLISWSLSFQAICGRVSAKQASPVVAKDPANRAFRPESARFRLRNCTFLRETGFFAKSGGYEENSKKT